MARYIADSYLYRAVGADIDGACGKCIQSRSDCMCYSLSRMDICGIIEEAPTADVVEVKRGMWNAYYDDDDPQDGIWKCSVCGYIRFIEDSSPSNFCPDCGAKMCEKESDNG